MDKKLMITSAVSGLASIVLGLLSARTIPQKVGFVQPTQSLMQQGGNLQVKTPQFRYVHNSKIHEGITFLNFGDDLAYGMKAFAEYEGKRIELNWLYRDERGATFFIPEELKKVERFSVDAFDRDGNRSQPRTIYTSYGEVVEQNVLQ